MNETVFENNIFLRKDYKDPFPVILSLNCSYEKKPCIMLFFECESTEYLFKTVFIK